MATTEAKNRLAELEQAFTILEETPAFREEWTKLVLQHDVKGKAAHDARIVAAMTIHGITTLLTFNKPHFTRYDRIAALAPHEVHMRP